MPDFAELRRGGRPEAMRICLLLHKAAGMDVGTALALPIVEAEEWIAAANRLERELNKQ